MSRFLQTMFPPVSDIVRNTEGGKPMLTPLLRLGLVKMSLVRHFPPTSSTPKLFPLESPIDLR